MFAVFVLALKGLSAQLAGSFQPSAVPKPTCQSKLVLVAAWESLICIVWQTPWLSPTQNLSCQGLDRI